MLLCIGRVSEASAAGQSALTMLEPLDPGRELARALSAMAEISLHTDDGEGAIKWGSLAVDLGERTGDAEALVLGLNCVGTIELVLW